MNKRIMVFYGSKRDFEAMVEAEVDDGSTITPFMELIQQYNARLRPNESGVKEQALGQKIYVEYCAVRADDYGSVLEHVLTNFVTIVSLNHEIDTLFIHNPPRKVVNSLESYYKDKIIYRFSEYPSITRTSLKTIYKDLNRNIIGQENCKKQIISGIYKLISNNNGKPIVLMFYGPSGVGKTESAKSISKSLGGELLRIQFSMMQTVEAYNYIFGAEHSKNSFARDMLGRESNIILIDEFDKVNPNFYNAFYELFDEGKFVDTNYDVDLSNTLFLCTCNFSSEAEIKEALGPAMFSRIGACISYQELSDEQKKRIVNDWYKDIVLRLEDDEKTIIDETNILNWFNDNVNRYDNIRILKTKMENAIFDKLADVFIIDEIS